MSSSRAGLDAGLLELLIGSAGVDGLVLADVADEQHAVVWAEALQEVVHLPRARQARFVEHIEARVSVVRRLAPRQMPLQRARRDAGVGQLLRRA